MLGGVTGGGHESDHGSRRVGAVTRADTEGTTARPAARVSGVATLSRTATGDVVPTAVERALAVARDRDPVIAWAGTAAITFLAAFLRLWKLGLPEGVPLRRDLLRQGRLVAGAPRLRHRVRRRRQRARSSPATSRGTCGPADPSMVVHPEVGKYLIGAAELITGMDPFGWRLAPAMIGSMMVLVMIRLARRVTGSTMLGLVAGDADVLRRTAVRAVPAGAAGHLRGVLRALRGQLHGRRPGLVPRPAGARATEGEPAPRLGRLGPPAAGGGRGCCSPASGGVWRWAPSGRRSSRWPRSALLFWAWSAGGAALVRRAAGAWPKAALVDAAPGAGVRRAAAARGLRRPPGPAG